MGDEQPTALSLFSGIGGLDHGLHLAGWRHVGFCEGGGDPNGTKEERAQWQQGVYRRAVLAARWPGVPIYEDVATLQPEHGADLVTGGFPCQDLSVAGRRAGLAGERSGLFFEFARIVDAVRPRWLLAENVPGSLSSNGGRDFGIVLGTLADIGYGLAWRILDSRYFGVPQRRRRVYIVGALADGDPRAAAERAGQVLAVSTRCPGHPATRRETREDAAVASLSGLGTGCPDDNDGQGGRLVTAYALNAKAGYRDGDADTTYVAAPLSHGSNPNSNMAGRRREDDENLVPIAGPLGGGNGGAGRRSEDDPNLVAQTGVRRLTPTECERLQALPDGWTQLGNTPDSKRYAALGDAVTSTVAEWIGQRLIEAMIGKGRAWWLRRGAATT